MSRAAIYQMGLSSKSAKVSIIVLGVAVLLVGSIGFQLGTHRHTGILRTLAEAKHFLRDSVDVLPLCSSECKRTGRAAT